MLCLRVMNIGKYMKIIHEATQLEPYEPVKQFNNLTFKSFVYKMKL